MTRNKAKIRGALSAVTLPTPVADIVNRFNIQEHLFFSLAEELIRTRRIAGSLTGGKKANKATFNPAAYAHVSYKIVQTKLLHIAHTQSPQAQLKWTDDFLAQNGYLEYDAVARLGRRLAALAQIATRRPLGVQGEHDRDRRPQRLGRP